MTALGLLALSPVPQTRINPATAMAPTPNPALKDPDSGFAPYNTDVDSDGDAKVVDADDPDDGEGREEDEGGETDYSRVRTRYPATDASVNTAPQTGRIAQENALPGTDTWASIGNYDLDSLSAFVGATSVNAGGAINIHVKSTGTSATARLYRLGYYQGHGARLYANYASFATPAQPACTRVSATGLVSCPWSPSLTINTDPNWISGIFLLQIDSNNGYRFFVYFVLRNDSYHSALLAMEPTKTNQAYNRYGGESLYYSGNNEGRDRAYQVSFDRPYLGGAGTGGFFSHDHESVRWLEASGYDVSYISDIDRAANPNIFAGHSTFMVMGHDEYWTWDERISTENALSAGVNMVFNSGNESYWQIRLGPSSTGANRIIICYKDSALDPAPAPTPKTITFTDLNRPENALLGTNYQSYYDEEQFGYPFVVSAPASSWYFDCTGLQPGDQVNNIIGEEWNGILNNGFTPPGLQAIAHTTIADPHGVGQPQDSTIYTDASGAMVFEASSIHFSWGLMDHSYANEVFQPDYLSQAADPRIQQMMANILDRFTGVWNGTPRTCGSQTFYQTPARSTRTPMPQASMTPPAGATATSVPSRTPTRSASVTATLSPSRTATRTPTRTVTSTATPGSSCTVQYTSSDIPKPIPDLGSTTSMLSVGNAGTISNIVVTGLTIAHTYSSDVTAFLIAPDGTRVQLFSHVCGSGVWTTGNTGFSITGAASPVMGTVCPPNQGTYLPNNESMSAFIGHAANGTWTLEVSDDGQYDTGTLYAWGIQITSGTCQAGSPTVVSTATRTSTAVPQASSTRTSTPLASPTSTRTPTRTATTPAGATATRTTTSTRTATPTRTATIARTNTPTRTRTPGSTPTQPSSATATATPACSMTYASRDIPKAVPDQGVITSTLTIGDIGTIASVRVANFGIEHTYASDLSAYLIAPDGTRTTLFTPVCGAGVWTTANTGFSITGGASSLMGALCPPAQGTYLPKDGDMSVFAGHQSAGTWKLEVHDGGPYDVGTLRTWSLVIAYQNGCPLGPSWESTATAAVPSPTATATPIQVSFNDVPAGSAFAPYVQWMSSRGVVSGYACGSASEPCPGVYFRPGSNVTRAQLLKMVVNASGWPLANPKNEEATFADVPRDSAFYSYIETAAEHGAIGGYACGAPAEPCDSQNRPYFRPGVGITRGQLAKVVALSQGYDLTNPATPTFADVPATQTFFTYIEAIYSHSVIAGYNCGSVSEPCDAQNRPYFRPQSSATRGQVSKIVTIANTTP